MKNKSRTKLLVLSALTCFGVVCAGAISAGQPIGIRKVLAANIDSIETSDTATIKSSNTSTWGTATVEKTYGKYFIRSMGANKTTKYTFNKNAMICMTATTGKIKKVSVGETNKTLNVYGSNTAYAGGYTTAVESSKRGTLIGTLTTSSLSLDVSGYDYILIHGNDSSTNVGPFNFEYDSAPSSPLASISVASTNHRTFLIGSTFAGETIKAKFEDESEKEVTATYSGYNMNTLGTQTVTASYTDGDITKTVSYEITIKDYDAVPSGNYTVVLNPGVIRDSANGNHKILQDSNGNFYNSVLTVSGNYTYQAPSGSYPSEFKFAKNSNKEITFSVNEEGVKISSVVVQLSNAHPENFTANPNVSPESYSDSDITSNGYKYSFNSTSATLTNGSTYDAFFLLVKVNIEVNRNSHNVTCNLTNASFNNTGKQDFDADFSGTITADTGYNLPSSISMTVAGAAFTDFTYNNETGAISIAAGKVTGDLVITATAVAIDYSLTYTGDSNITLKDNGSVSDLVDGTTIHYGDTITRTLEVAEGYKEPTVTVMNGGTEDTTAYNASTHTLNISVKGDVSVSISTSLLTVEEVTLDKTAITINTETIGGSVTIAATVLPSGLLAQYKTVTWSHEVTSGDITKDTDFTLNTDGNAITVGVPDTQNIKEGTIKLTATSDSDGSKTAECIVTLEGFVLKGVNVGAIEGQESSVKATQYIYNGFTSSMIDFTGIGFNLVYSPSTKTETFSATDVTWDAPVVGEHPHGTYLGYEVSVNEITFAADALDTIEFDSTLMSKKSYYASGSWDFSGLTIKGTMLSGQDATIAQNSVVYTTETTVASLSGKTDQQITVKATYAGKEATTTIDGITVEAVALKEYYVSAFPSKKSYILGEDLDLTGLAVKGVNNDGTEVNLTADQYTVDTSSYNKLAMTTGAGYTITVTAAGLTLQSGKQNSFNVTVGKVTPAAEKKGYFKVTSVDDLKAGDKVVFVSTDSEAVANGIASGNTYLSKTDATFDEETGKLTSNTFTEFTLGGSTGAWTFSVGDSLLGATAAKKINLSGSGTTTWTISIDEDGDATIGSTSTSYGYLKYNSSDPRFTTYTSGQNAIQIYKYYNIEAESGDPIAMTSVIYNGANADLKAGDVVKASEFKASILSNDDTTNDNVTTGLTLNCGEVQNASEITLKEGENVITVKKGELSCDVTLIARGIRVTDATVVTAADSKIEMYGGDTVQLSAAQSRTEDQVKYDVDNPGVTWTSSNEDVATVSDTGLVTTKVVSSDTTVTITATPEDTQEVSAVGTITLTVKSNDIAGIELVSAPTKTGYNYNEQFNASGLAVRYYYENPNDRYNGKTAETADVITYDDNKADFNLGIADGTKLTTHGENACSVSYNGYNLAEDITLSVDRIPVSLEITGYNATVYHGQEYALGEYTATVTYSDTEAANVTIKAEDVTVDTSKLGTPDVAIATYTENGVTVTANLTVTVIQDQVDSVEITTEPAKMTFDHNGTFDPTGIVAHVTYLSGYEEDVGADELEFAIADADAQSPNVFNNTGDIVVTATFTDQYGNQKSDTITCSVIKTIESSEIESIVIKNSNGVTIDPANDDIFEGDQLTARVTVKFTYSDGSTSTSTKDIDLSTNLNGITKFSITDKDLGKTVQMQYTLDNVIQVAFKGIEVDTTNATKALDSYIEGQTFDPTGITVTGLYNKEGNSINVALDDPNLKIDYPETFGKGNQTVTFTYTKDGKDYTKAITINVAAKVVNSLVATSEANKTTYYAGDKFDPTGLVLEATYNDGSIVSNITNFEVIDADAVLTAGQTSVKIKYDGKVYECPITVLPNDLVSISVDGTYTGTVTLNGSYTFDGKIIATYANGTTADITNEVKSQINVDTTSTGVKVITLNFNGKTVELNVTVTYDAVDKVNVAYDGSTTVEPGSTVYVNGAVNNPNADPRLSWSSSDESIATVDSTGKVTFTGKAGSVTITATSVADETKSNSVSFVSKIAVNSINVNPEIVELDLNGTDQANVTVTVLPADATNSTVTYEVSGDGVTVVSKGNGVYTILATKVGEYTVTFTVNDDGNIKTTTVTVTVVDTYTPPTPIDPGDEDQPDNPGQEDQPGTPDEEPEPVKVGCGGSIGATTLAVTLVSALGAGLLLSKKRKEEDK